MGASVYVYWPGTGDDQQEAAPGFWNDCKAWGNWMVEREAEPRVRAQLTQLGLQAIMTCRTDGMRDDQVLWVAPEELRKAADELRVLVLAKDPQVSTIIDTYARHANQVNPVHEELAADLDDVSVIAEFARDEGATRMTLHVSW